MRMIIKIALLTLPAIAAAEPARDAGRAVGQFGAGIGEAVGEGLTRGLSGLQPEWITISPRSKEECLRETGGVINPAFIRCRNGRQEFVKFSPDGRRQIISERPIPFQQ